MPRLVPQWKYCDDIISIVHCYASTGNLPLQHDCVAMVSLQVPVQLSGVG
jgi:hypothetical protein